jgi:hypothetical protein
LLVVSPFVDDGLLSDLTEWQAPMSLLSRPESLARLQPATLKRFELIWTLDELVRLSEAPDEVEEACAKGARRVMKRRLCWLVLLLGVTSLSRAEDGATGPDDVGNFLRMAV